MAGNTIIHFCVQDPLETHSRLWKCSVSCRCLISQIKDDPENFSTLADNQTSVPEKALSASPLKAAHRCPLRRNSDVNSALSGKNKRAENAQTKITQIQSWKLGLCFRSLLVDLNLLPLPLFSSKEMSEL